MIVECRKVQLEQVFLNLLNNSYDAEFSLNEKWVELSVKCTNDTVCVCVTDSGNGISPHVVEKIMEPFLQPKMLEKGQA